jgi:hypothetical protein
MIGITILPEQLAAAPPDISRWFERKIASRLACAAADAVAANGLAQPVPGEADAALGAMLGTPL